MSTFNLFKNDIIAEILLEPSSLKGIKHVANIIADDIKLVTGLRPNIIHEITECRSENVIIIATINNSTISNTLEKDNQIN